MPYSSPSPSARHSISFGGFRTPDFKNEIDMARASNQFAGRASWWDVIQFVRCDSVNAAHRQGFAELIALMGEFHEDLQYLGAVNISRHTIGSDTGCGFNRSLDN